jgi:uncharacterized Tic20 family protein
MFAIWTTMIVEIILILMIGLGWLTVVFIFWLFKIRILFIIYASIKTSTGEYYKYPITTVYSNRSLAP